MSCVEALGEFDSLAYDQIDYPQQPGTVRCCGLPVVMDSSSGVKRISCLKCGRRVETVARQWIIAEWGTKGSSLNPPTRRPQ